MSDIDGYQCIELGRRFVELHKSEKMTSFNLDFHQTGVESEACGTVACHGGHAAVMLGAVSIGDMDDQDGYLEGAAAIARFIMAMGIRVGHEDLILWARSNPAKWGNPYGETMFTMSGYRAFGFSYSGLCTVGDIGMHWIAVGCRVLGLGVIGDE